MFLVKVQMAQAGKKHQFTAEIWCWHHLEKLEKWSETMSNRDKYKVRHCPPSQQQGENHLRRQEFLEVEQKAVAVQRLSRDMLLQRTQPASSAA